MVDLHRHSPARKDGHVFFTMPSQTWMTRWRCSKPGHWDNNHDEIWTFHLYPPVNIAMENGPFIDDLPTKMI